MSHLAGGLTAGRRILIPKTPSADPPYTTAFFDVGDEPWAFETPDVHDRYIVPPSVWMRNLVEVSMGQDNAKMAHSCFMDAQELNCIFACI
jgi:hypothetical protein